MAATKVAEMYGELMLRDQKYYAGMDKARQASAGFVGKLTGMFGKIGPALAAIGTVAAATGLVAGIQKAISAASDLNESISKTQATFQDSAGVITSAADEMASKFGIVKKEFIDGAVNLGLMGKAAGMAAPEAAQLGVKFAKLAADIASFDNIPVEEALVTLRSGLAGESEPLRRFGVLVDEAAVKNEAMAMGLSATGKNLDMQTKTLARASLIYKGFADRQGDLERTAGSAANMARNLGGQMENLYAEIGTTLLPAVGEVLPKIGEVVQELGAVFREHTDDIKKFADMIGIVLVGALEKLPDIVHQNIENFNSLIAAWESVPDWVKDIVDLGPAAAAKRAAIPAPDELSPLQKKALEVEKIRKRNMEQGLILGGVPQAAPLPQPFQEKIREVERRRADLAALMPQLAPGVPGMAPLYQPRAPGMSLLRPEGMQTDEERLKALQDQKSIIAGLIPEVVQRSSQLFTEGGSMEQQFQQKILEQTDKQDEANKLLKSIEEEIIKLNETQLKKATEKGWAMIAPAGAAK